MKLEQSFEVEAPIDAVWAALTDVERVAPCLPGAEVTGTDDDGNYTGTFQVKLGPTTAAYRGKLKMEDLDEASHRATMRAEGTDKRGQGGAKATMISTMTESGTVTTVHVDTDFTITGRLASFGRGGMIKDISNRLLKDFASCLQAHLASEQAVGGGTPAPVAAAPAADTPTDESPAAAAPPAEGIANPAAPAPEAPRSGSVPPPDEPPAPVARPAAAPQPAKPINAFRLILGVLLDRIKRLFGRGG
jgi:carbon monoxide dehydrogenase subunit G